MLVLCMLSRAFDLCSPARMKSVTEISNKQTPGGKVLSPEAVKILLEKLDSVRADADTPLDEVIGSQTERKLAAANQRLVDERSSFEKR